MELRMLNMNERSQMQVCAGAATPRRAVLARRHGFTLMELLVVVVIIGLLMGLLFPALSYARQQARKARAKAEVRQLVVAWTAYLNDNPDENPSEPTMSANMADRIRKYMEIKPGAFLDPWQQPYAVSFDPASVGDVKRTYQTRAFLYNYNRDQLGDEPGY